MAVKPFSTSIILTKNFFGVIMELDELMNIFLNFSNKTELLKCIVGADL